MSTRDKLRALIKEELGRMIDLAPAAEAPRADVEMVGGMMPAAMLSIAGVAGVDDTSFAECMQKYVAAVRCAQLWFHGAHNLTRGTGFAGDHVSLYADIYEAFDAQFDAVVEKAIGLSGGDQNMGCPQRITRDALRCMEKYSSPSELTAVQIAAEGLAMLSDHTDLIESTFDKLEASGELALGLEDVLGSNANEVETFKYLLQQRVVGSD